MNKKNILVTSLVVVIAVVAVVFLGSLVTSRIPAQEYQLAYRLVPEKISRSAVVTVMLPLTANAQSFNFSKQVTFDPAIDGHWISGQKLFGAAANVTDEPRVAYFQPNKPLDTGKHYNVTLALAEGEAIHADFLTVSDPEVSAILPHGDDEVSIDTKISIVFNRPMVPLTTLDQLATDDIPVTISPKTQGRFKWISTNTLQFIPADGLVSSTKYTVSVNSGFKSMEGLEVKPTQSSFTTLHLRYWSDGSSYSSQSSAVRGYNQPLLVRFNQPIDLEMTKNYITLQNSVSNESFVVKYAPMATSSDPVSNIDSSSDEDSGDDGFVGSIPGLRFMANVLGGLGKMSASAKSSASDDYDQTVLAIYPAGGERAGWKPEETYTLTINKVYPKSSGSITIDSARSFTFDIDQIYSGLEAISPRTNQASIDRFDPEGQLGIRFYEDINLSSSRIVGLAVDKVEYGQKCAENKSPCSKVPDRKKVLVSFKKGSLNPGDTTQVNLDSIVTDAGVMITSKLLPIVLTMYKPLVVYKTVADKNLNSLTICSNNPLDVAGKNNKITSEPVFKTNSWQQSYLINYSYSGMICSVGQFQTAINGYLFSQTNYLGTVNVSDVFGGVAQGTFAFTTRPLNENDYELQSLQGNDIVTTPGKTQLAFSATYLPSVTVTVCRLSPYNYYKVRDNYKLQAKDYCQQKVSKEVSIPTDTPGQAVFSVDIRDYFADPVGNYAVMISSPLMPIRRYNTWRSADLTYVSVTNLTVTEKRINPLEEDNYDSLRLTGDQVNKLQNLYWVIDVSSQKPVIGASVSLYKDGQVVATGKTNDEGLSFVTPVAGVEAAVVMYGNDAVVISGYNSSLGYAREAANVRKFYLYNDKPIYRPGQEVNIKGIYRLGYDGYYENPPTQPLTITIRDSSNTVIKETKVTPNDFGTFNTSMTLDSSARLGTYSACVTYQCVRFDVLQYAPAAFKVTTETSKDDYIIGDKPEVNVTATYYFGVPVSNAGADYHVTSQYYHFDKYTKEYFNFNNLSDDIPMWGYYYGDRYVGQGHVTLDENGRAVVKPDLSASKLNNPMLSKIIIVDTTVKNQQGRSVSSQKSFMLHAAPIYIGSIVDKPFRAVGQDSKLKLKTVDTEGNPKSMAVKVSLYKVSWVNDAVGDESAPDWNRKRELVKSFDVQTDSNGDAQTALAVNAQGQYEIDVTSRDAGAGVGSRSTMYVYGDGNVLFQSTDDTSLELVPNNAHLKTGDTGEVLIKVPEGKGKALITIERGKIFSYKVVDITGSLMNFQFPVISQYYPNVYVSVTSYAPNRSVRYGNYSFVIDSDQKKLKLTIQSDKKEYKPGDQVTLKVMSTDDVGQPVMADVSLAVVDMSVLALRGNPKKDLVANFYGNAPLTIQTYSNFKTLLKPVDVEEANAMAKDGKGGSGGDSKSEKSRGVFREVALWMADIETDTSGVATITFTLPDNLTTWQAEVVGVTDDTKVGATYKEFGTSKDLMVVSLKPRFVLPGDRFFLGATIFNNSKADFSGSVVLKTDSLDTSKAPLTKDISIKTGESKTVYWDVAVPYTMSAGVTKYSISASGSGLSDGVEDSLSVKENSAYEVTATAAQTNTSAREYIYVPSNILPGQGGVTIKSSATVAVFLSDALKYLVNYPYGCTEQIGSQIRAIALLKSAQAIPNISSSSVTDKIMYQGKEYTADELVRTGLTSIYNRQNYDGGFKLWSEDSGSSYWATMEAINTFDVLDRAGYIVDFSVWSKAVQYISDQYQKGDRIFTDSDIIDISEVLFTRPQYITGGVIRQQFNLAVSHILANPKSPTDKLITISQILHRYQLSSSDASKADLMLENRLFVDSRGTFLDKTSGGYRDTAVSNSARYIGLLAMRHQSSPELPNLIRWLVSSRSKDGAWGSTVNTLSVVAGLTEYMKWQPETSATFTLDTTLNGTAIDHFDFTAKNILSQLSKVVPMDQLKSGSINMLMFAKTNDTGTSQGKIYYDLSFKYYLPANTMAPRDEGFTIKRSFYKLSDTKGDQPVRNAKIGDVLREHLEITVPATRLQVAIEDFIPAGMEIVDTSLATEDQSLKNTKVSIKNSKLWPDHKEWRDDRAFLYEEQLSPGTYEFNYFVRALVPGTYTQLPAQVSEMYTPENFGRSGAGLFTIEQ